MADLNVVLFRRGKGADGTDNYWRIGEEFGLSDFGGVLPQVGDTIVSPSGDNQPVQTVYQVEARWFLPYPKPGFANVGLVIQERTTKPFEQHLVSGGG